MASINDMQDISGYIDSDCLDMAKIYNTIQANEAIFTECFEELYGTYIKCCSLETTIAGQTEYNYTDTLSIVPGGAWSVKLTDNIDETPISNGTAMTLQNFYGYNAELDACCINVSISMEYCARLAASGIFFYSQPVKLLCDGQILDSTNFSGAVEVTDTNEVHCLETTPRILTAYLKRYDCSQNLVLSLGDPVFSPNVEFTSYTSALSVEVDSVCV